MEFIPELEQPLQSCDLIFLAVDVSHSTARFTETEWSNKVNFFLESQGSHKSSTLIKETNTSAVLIKKTLQRFQSKASAPILVKRYQSKKLEGNKVENYKDEHPGLQIVFKDIYMKKADYLKLVKLMKFALLLTSSAVNVERGFCFNSPCYQASQFTESMKS